MPTLKRPFLITLDSVQTFLDRRAAKRLPFTIIEVVERDEVSKYGNSNYFWRVVVRTSHGRKVLFVKQARHYNRRAWEVHKRKLTMDPLRICGEYRLIQLLRKLWGKHRVPEIYYFDLVRCVVIMSDVSYRGALLAYEFEHDRIHPELGTLLGTLFGKLHSTTYRHRLDCCGSTRWRRTMMRLFGLWWFGKGMLKYVPANRVRAFYRAARRAPCAWVWGDPVIRNIFVKPHAQVSMVDFDHTLSYDPALDSGMLLAQWMWMGLKNAKLKNQSEKFIGDFWAAYTKAFERKKLGGEIAAIRKRSLQWSGIYLVSRTDGMSGSYFAQYPAWEKKIRALGIKLFLERV